MPAAEPELTAELAAEHLPVAEPELTGELAAEHLPVAEPELTAEHWPVAVLGRAVGPVLAVAAVQPYQ